jgi:uncharacterized protein (DUF427 family)
MKKAVFQGKVIAESNYTIHHQGKIYFPHHSLKENYFEDSDVHTINPQFGIANYYDLKIGQTCRKNAAHYHPCPLPHAKFIQNYVVFDDQEVEIKDEE